MENNIGKVIKGIGWVIIVLGIIGSFILGDAVPIQSVSLYSSSEEYNVVLAVVGIISSIVSGALFLGLGEVLNLLQTNINIQKQILYKSYDSNSNDKENELPEI